MARQTVFVDTSYIYAIINPNDQWHSRALELEAKVASANLSLITTQFILAEIADGLSAVRYRKSAGEVIHNLLDDTRVNVVPASAELFNAGLELYESRPDKNGGTHRLLFVCHHARQRINRRPHNRRPLPPSRV